LLSQFMDYILLFLFGWMVVCAPAIIVTAVANGRRRRETAELNDKVASLTKQLEALERRTRVNVAHVQPETQPAHPVVAMKISSEETRVAAALPVSPVAPVREPVVPKQPAPWVSAQPPSPPAVAPAVAAHTQLPTQPSSSQPRPVEVGGIPLTPSSRPPEEPARAVTPPPPTPKAPAPPAAVTVTPLPAAPAAKAPEAAMAMAASSSVAQPPMSEMIGSARVSASTGSAGFSSTPAARQPHLPQKASMSVEEKLGTNWLPKLGIAIVVIGVGFLVAAKWGGFAPWLRVVILYLGGLAMLAGGIFAERKERYRTLGRALIGGGWAVTVLVTYGLRHAPFMAILSSNALDLVLLFAVIGVMVWHTLKYDSQLVTGASFLLGFAAITLNPDPPYNLLAGALLVTGMTVIVLRRRWFELEIFGILASYLNHFYWLYSVFNLQETRAPFPHHTISMLLMIGYWVIFRCSYVWRKVQSDEEESVSTIAGLLNPLLFLGVMKYQSFHPEWAFYALLGMGAAEFVFGQLPVSRRRVAPFRVLSSLGVALMAAAVPFKYSGNSLEMLWLAGGEAFLMAGIFVRERLFRGFGLIISSLVALYVMVARITPLVQEVMNAQPHHHSQLGIGLAVIAAVLYANTNIIGRRWKDLFKEEIESQALRTLSFAASAFAVCAVYALVGDNAVSIVLALLVFSLCVLGKQFSIGDLIYQAHWITVAAFIQTIVTGQTLETSWHNVPGRVLMFVPVAGLLYMSSRYVRLSETSNKELCFPAYSWAATSLLAVLIWFQSPVWCMGLLWIGLGLALSLVGETLKRGDLKWQTFALVLISFVRALDVSFAPTSLFHHLTYRLISVSLTAAGIYLLARWAPRREIRPIYTVAGTVLLTVLAYQEAPEPWIPVAWISLALVLGSAARRWNDRALLLQTHALSLLASGWTLYASFAPQYRGTRVQLISVALTAGLLYLLNWITDIAEIVGDARISMAYSWAGSLLLSWLIWYQLPPIDVSLVWGIFGLALFMIGEWKSWSFLRIQAYVALTCSFAHIFYANFNVLSAPDAARPEVFTVIPLVGIYFFIYWQLHGKKTQGAALESRIRIDDLVACLGTATLAALGRFELPAESVAIGYAALVIATLLAARFTRLQVFIYQALALLGMAAFRLSMNNFYHLREAFGSNLSAALWTIGVLAAGVPICLSISRNGAQEFTGPRWVALLAKRSEQPMFFVPFVLMAVLLALKVAPGMITLAWGAEAVVVFVLALWARERSFRLAGLALLLLSAAKIVLWDVWQLNDPTARYLTLIGVGLLILIVSYLISRNREALREYL
jgi:uncharacterized membrane protein